MQPKMISKREVQEIKARWSDESAPTVEQARKDILQLLERLLSAEQIVERALFEFGSELREDIEKHLGK